MKKGKTITFFSDMDGCIAIFNPNASIEEVCEEGYFLNREVDQKYAAFLRHLEGYNIRAVFASSAYGPIPAEEKRIWLDKNDWKENILIVIPYGVDKKEYIIENYPELIGDINFLSDDLTRNLLKWDDGDGMSILSSDPKFIGIKYVNDINDTHKTWQGIRIGLSSPEVDAMEIMSVISLLASGRTL